MHINFPQDAHSPPLDANIIEALVVPRCGSSLRQFGCNTKVWQVSKRDFHQRSIEGAVGSGCGGEYGSLTMGVVGELTPPAWRGRFPAFGFGDVTVGSRLKFVWA